MKRDRIKVCVFRVGGTNCDMETKIAFEELGVNAEIVHFKKIAMNKGLLENYHVLVFPGGFSYGDYVRAGAIWGKEVMSRMLDELTKFIESMRPIVGICNGFQVLIESGILPGFENDDETLGVSLMTNDSMRYECRWVYLKHVNAGRCKLTRLIPKNKILKIPVAHNEGKFIISRERFEEISKLLLDNDQVVFTYVKPDGGKANGQYPYNPNGSDLDIAAICSFRGNVLGMMPHPERAFFGWQLPDWTRYEKLPQYGDGKLIFESIVGYLEEEF